MPNFIFHSFALLDLPQPCARYLGASRSEVRCRRRFGLPAKPDRRKLGSKCPKRKALKTFPGNVLSASRAGHFGPAFIRPRAPGLAPEPPEPTPDFGVPYPVPLHSGP